MRVLRLRSVVMAPLLAFLTVAVLPTRAPAQILKRIKKAVTSAVEDETLSQVDRIVRGKVRCVFDDLECIRGAEASGKGAVLTDDSGALLLDSEGSPVSDPNAGAELAGRTPATSRPGEGAWANYDFQPGDRILFLDDFTGDKIGDFPRRFELIEGNFELVDWEGGRYLQATSGGLFAIPLPETLPERFTAEFAVSLQHGNAYLRMMPGRAFFGRARNYAGSVVSVEYGRAGLRPAGSAGPTALSPFDPNTVKNGVVPVRIMADARYMKVFLGEQRVANVPNAVFPRSDTLFIAVGSATPSTPILLGPLRIAAGGRDLYDRLAANGRAVTQGILFATNSARIRPESTPTLEEIVTMLTEHPELRVAIEGHTDSEGEEAFNQDLSERRAAAVRTFLTVEGKIDPSRLESAGFGESKPVAENSTPEGRQQNRRVELVRLET